MGRNSIRGLAALGIAALIGWRVYSWGAPIHAEYRVIPNAAASAKLPGAGGERVMERAGKNTQKWRAVDVDEDGTWDEFITPDGTFWRPGAQSQPKRWLVVCLDGVPLATMQALWDRDHFREFFRPTATVSTLPSDTETALTDALRAAPVPGYEHLYYDRAAHRIRGGAWVTLSGAHIPYIRSLNYDSPGWAKALTYLLPTKAYRADINRFRQAFLDSNAPVFVAHIAASDAVLHVRTTEQAEPLLVDFESVLRDLYLDARGETGVLVFSDHGNTEEPSRSVPLEDFLSKHGWHVRDSINEAHDIVIPSYGLVGFAALYCRLESIEPISEQLRGLEGVEVIVSRHSDGGGATIRGAGLGNGSETPAELIWSADGRRYRYAAGSGDPLGLQAAFGELRNKGKLDRDGSASDADLFAATSLATYPDSAARIRAWAIDHVRNRADIMVTLLPGWYHGASSFGRVVTLAGTHGGLGKSSSLGFVMATYALPPATRVGNVIPARLLERP